MSPAERWSEVTGLPIADWADVGQQTRTLVAQEVEAGRYGLTDAQLDAERNHPVTRRAG